MGFIGSVWREYKVRKLRNKAQKMLSDPIIVAFLHKAVLDAMTFSVTKDETFAEKVASKKEEIARGVW